MTRTEKEEDSCVNLVLIMTISDSLSIRHLQISNLILEDSASFLENQVDYLVFLY
jgi:hypothetical protein